jgi:hypothetical protein
MRHRYKGKEVTEWAARVERHRCVLGAWPAGRRTSEWLEQVRSLPASGVSHQQAIEALDEGRASP